ncbi:alpha carbonic anhydrase [Protomyces lactucae-debilis]|uniref:Alpha carbonic anhydrase n=1 Tax=Protomyces lactucae-debilis TaxID=2754530 RepID=A0A1Y2FQ33_PROLT|nr:alpha carbonic anhydrase [Protomyces lactucae-debilis]ORY86112.1 alpha carbonic anhydrase [Protomyces lactucae-debilis]
MDASHLHKRAEGNDWAYEASYNWGKVNPLYGKCQNGTQQSPVPLEVTQGFSLEHIPTFNYTKTAGEILNWGYGPAFVPRDAELNTLSFDNETVYLAGWHVHSPADHSVSGKRAKAELHLVHKNAAGKERAVVAIRIDPSTRPSTFFTMLGNVFPGFEDRTRSNATVDLSQLISEVDRLSNFWTYKGSLTSPPCTEGLRWFVARDILFTDNVQMQRILTASTFSARAEQEVWMHQINA